MLLLPRSLPEQHGLWLGRSEGCSNFVAVSWQRLQDEERKTEQGKELISPWRSPCVCFLQQRDLSGTLPLGDLARGREPEAGQ